MGRKENVLRAQYSLWLQLGTQYTHSHTHTHGVGPVQIRCRTNLVESDQEKKWDVGLIIYTTSLIAQCLALWIGTVKLSGAILAVEFTLLFPFLFTAIIAWEVGQIFVVSLAIGMSSECWNEHRIHKTVDQCYEFWFYSDILCQDIVYS